MAYVHEAGHSYNRNLNYIYWRVLTVALTSASDSSTIGNITFFYKLFIYYSLKREKKNPSLKKNVCIICRLWLLFISCVILSTISIYSLFNVNNLYSISSISLIRSVVRCSAESTCFWITSLSLSIRRG